MSIHAGDVGRSLVCVTCHFLNLLQSCGQHVVEGWSSTFLKEKLTFVSLFLELIRKLDSSELNALETSCSTVRFRFPHINSNTFFEALQDPLTCVIQVLSRNPYLSKENRDCVFEFCLDAGLQIPHFHTCEDYGSSRADRYRLLEVHRFIRHLATLDTKCLRLFLDSCFETNPVYMTGLMISCLEQIADPIGKADDSLSTHIIDWANIVASKDTRFLVAFAHQDPLRLRDIMLRFPKLDSVALQLFDMNAEFETSSFPLSPSLLSGFAFCLANAVPCGPELVRRIEAFASAPNEFWKTVLTQLREMGS